MMVVMQDESGAKLQTWSTMIMKNARAAPTWSLKVGRRRQLDCCQPGDNKQAMIDGHSSSGGGETGKFHNHDQFTLSIEKEEDVMPWDGKKTKGQ